jgi:5,6-dimethylbenzimidazole synthase
LSEAPPVFDASFQELFLELLRWRRDVRHFGSHAVADEDMREILRCAAFAPSVGNAQPWRFVQLRTPAIRDALAAHVDGQSATAAKRYLGTSRHDHYLSLKLHALREAPELLAVFCDEQPEAGHGLGIATMPEMLRYSCVMAVHNLWLAARLRGIGVGWVSILDPQEVPTLLDVPAHWSLIALLCIGYPTEEADIPELETHGWQAREPLTNHVFER